LQEGGRENTWELHRSVSPFFPVYDRAVVLTDGSVNMYASTWICTKEVGIELDDVRGHLRKTSLAEFKLEAPAMRMH
jgi:hypothetical protein